MSFLDEYILCNWRHSAGKTLDRLLEQECRPAKGIAEKREYHIVGVLEQERLTIQRVFGGSVIPCLPGDEIERQRAQKAGESQKPSADAYVMKGQGDMMDKSTSLVLLECKYRVHTENVNARAQKAKNLYYELCNKFDSSRSFLEAEGRVCHKMEIVIFNATAVDDMRDAIESLCIGEGHPIFKVVDTAALARSGEGQAQVHHLRQGKAAR